MRTILLVFQLAIAAIWDFARREVYSDQAAQQPPIRYDGDPTEIYLA